ncbi:winged helix-turn-helix domain-containing protein [Halobaculum sp. EA56]|uniref:winged helix-turn-helix domain-containing protein n=1 Tax=Halobaculum sp. EA56 TaxID=3421648 RepID=UPI003EB766AF
MGGDESSPRRTFELLADETRLGIITALGDASGRGGYATLAFSELQEAVGVEDSGQFNYHLQQLTGDFVESDGGGYKLTLAGIRAYQAVVAHSFTPRTRIEPFPVPDSEPCDACGGTLEAWYEDGRAHIACSECGDVVHYYPLSAKDFDMDDPGSFLRAAAIRVIRDESSMLHGVCPYCTGEPVWSLEPSSDHWEEKDLREEDLIAHVACERCAWFVYGDPAGKLRFHPVVSSFLLDHGADPWEDFPWRLPFDRDLTVLSMEPPKAEIEYAIDGDRLRVVVDEHFEVVEHEEIGGD